MRQKRKMAVLSLTVLLALAVCSLAAAYPDSPEKVMEAYLKAALKGDSVTAYPFLSKNMKTKLSQADFDKQLAVFRGSQGPILEKAKQEGMDEMTTKFMIAFLQAFLERVEFKEIKDVKIEGDSATLTAVLLMPNLDEPTPELSALQTNMPQMMQDNPEEAKLKEICSAAVKSAKLTGDEQEIKLIKEDGQWHIDDDDALFNF